MKLLAAGLILSVALAFGGAWHVHFRCGAFSMQHFGAVWCAWGR